MLPLLAVAAAMLPVGTGSPAELARISARVRDVLRGPEFDFWVARFRRAALAPPGWDRPTGSQLQSIDVGQLAAVMPGGGGPITAAPDIETQIAAALRMEHPRADSVPCARPCLEAAVDFVSSFADKPPGALEAERERRWGMVVDCMACMARKDASLALLQPAGVLRTPSFASLATSAIMIAAHSWPAHNLISNLVHGFPCVGDYPDTGIFREEERPAQRSMGELHHPPHNWRLMFEVANDGAAAEAAGGDRLRILERVAEKKDAEVDAGIATRHDSVESVDALYGKGRWRAHKCFGVVQGTEKDGTTPKVRPCDNCKSSLTNECFGSHETIANENCMFPSLVAALFDARGVSSLLIGTDDVRLAYRMMGCATPQFTVVALYHPGLGRPVLYTMRGHNFGLTSAVLCAAVPSSTVSARAHC